ncbi:hypothetical protein IFM53868_07654 [Aspergillus udagawae]|uniref:Uncharacterized protein n=1 Tax=Aspergillus udagawae TaxID=91492 RepID=A0ABQ1B6H6_9EURO|nr:hypothetical protein IFM53868_07654 [Aspergillus udagawae]
MELDSQQSGDLPIRPLLLLREEEPQGENPRGVQAQLTPRDPIYYYRNAGRFAPCNLPEKFESIATRLKGFQNLYRNFTYGTD